MGDRDPSVALPDGADPAARSRELRRAHAAFTRDGRVDAPVRAVIARSWRRCARARLSPECAPRVELAGADLRAYREEHPLARVMPLFRDLVGAFAAHGAHLLALYEDESVSPVTLRAEMSRLRTLLGPAAPLSHSYRPARPLDADFTALTRRLAVGAVSAALHPYARQGEDTRARYAAPGTEGALMS